MPRFHAIVLAGGRASRLDGIDKLLVRVDGRALLSRAVSSVAEADRVVVVGPAREASLPRAVTWVREDPPFSGPAHAVTAGLTALAPAPDDRVLVLAGDLIRPDLVVAALCAGPGNRVAVDPGGRRQWASSLVRAGDLAAAAAAVDTPGAPLRALIGPLDPTEVPLTAAAGADLDTPADLKEYADDA
jgi:molybdopterin-guanine dinucleotide biosynthesis protein A